MHYEDNAHLPASTFKDIPGILYSGEDEVVMPPDDQDVVEIDEERMLSEVILSASPIDNRRTI